MRTHYTWGRSDTLSPGQTTDHLVSSVAKRPHKQRPLRGQCPEDPERFIARLGCYSGSNTVPQGMNSAQGWSCRLMPGLASTQVGHRNGSFQERIVRNQLHCTTLLGKVFRAFPLTDLRKGTMPGSGPWACAQDRSVLTGYYHIYGCLGSVTTGPATRLV